MEMVKIKMSSTIPIDFFIITSPGSPSTYIDEKIPKKSHSFSVFANYFSNAS